MPFSEGEGGVQVDPYRKKRTTTTYYGKIRGGGVWSRGSGSTLTQKGRGCPPREGGKKISATPQALVGGRANMGGEVVFAWTQWV